MNIGDYQLGWFDFLVVGLMVAGILHGRKRGMTEEFPALLQWIVILVGGALLYKPIGSLLSNMTGMGKLFWFVMSYLLWGITIKLATVWIVRSMGDKISLSNMWGKAEYPLGMAAGCLRMVFTALFCLALLNARLYTNEELTSMAQFQKDNFGSVSLPTLGELQLQVFRKSIAGKAIKNHSELLLIKSTAPRGGKSGGNQPYWQPKKTMDSLTT